MKSFLTVPETEVRYLLSPCQRWVPQCLWQLPLLLVATMELLHKCFNQTQICPVLVWQRCLVSCLICIRTLLIVLWKSSASLKTFECQCSCWCCLMKVLEKFSTFMQQQQQSRPFLDYFLKLKNHFYHTFAYNSAAFCEFHCHLIKKENKLDVACMLLWFYFHCEFVVWILIYY